MTDKTNPPSRSKPRNKYDREIVPNVYVDVYDVLRAFKTGSPAIDHAIKKLLAAGERGDKCRLIDIGEAFQSIESELNSMSEWNNNEPPVEIESIRKRIIDFDDDGK